MKNLLIGIGVAVLIIFGIYTIFDYNKPKDSVDLNESSDTFVRDEFGEKYDIDNLYFVDSNSTEVFNLIETDETFVVFIGRET